MDIRESDLYNMHPRSNDAEIKKITDILENILKTLKSFERRIAKLEKKR